jgi:hypothetical protein
MHSKLQPQTEASNDFHTLAALPPLERAAGAHWIGIYMTEPN